MPRMKPFGLRDHLSREDKVVVLAVFGLLSILGRSISGELDCIQTVMS